MAVSLQPSICLQAACSLHWKRSSPRFHASGEKEDVTGGATTTNILFKGNF